MSRYTRCGRQILDNGKHMADTADELAAMQILNALQDMERRATASPDLADAIELTNIGERERRYQIGAVTLRCEPAVVHAIQRQGDETACSCGLRWGNDEDDPHETQ